jgi:hypothetical protein
MHLPDAYRELCLICDVIDARVLVQHVRFEELPSGFASSLRGVVVFFHRTRRRTLTST